MSLPDALAIREVGESCETILFAQREIVEPARDLVRRRDALYDFKFVSVIPVLGSIGAERCV